MMSWTLRAAMAAMRPVASREAARKLTPAETARIQKIERYIVRRSERPRRSSEPQMYMSRTLGRRVTIPEE